MSMNVTEGPLTSARRRLERATRAESAPPRAEPSGRSLAPRNLTGQCPTPTAAGALCKGKPTSSGFCVSHSPAHAGLLAQARKRGGQLTAARRALQAAKERAAAQLGISPELPDLSDVERVQRYITSVAMRVENRTLSPAQGNTLATLVRLSKDCISLATEIELLRQLEAQREGGAR